MFDMMTTTDLPVAAVGEVLDGLTREDLDLVRSGDLADDVVDLARAMDRLQAEWLRRVGELDRRGYWRVDGAASAAAWIRWRCRRTPTAARRAVTTGRALSDMPLTAGAAASGEITTDQVHVLADAHDTHPEAFPASEEILVGASTRHTTSELRRLVGYWSQNLDPDTTEAAAADAYEQRRLYLSSTMGGVGVLDAVLDPVGFDTVLTAVTAFTQPADRDQGDDRTPGQRRADALVEICHHALTRGDPPVSGGEPPHVTVLVDLATLDGASGHLAELGRTGTVITSETARRLACDAKVTRVVVAGDSVPLDVGRATRTVTPAQRKALAIRDHGCRFPGCDRPPTWCDAHHIKHWIRGGLTNLENLILLCRHHHTLIHLHRYTIDGTGQRPIFRRPDGTPLPRDPPW